VSKETVAKFKRGDSLFIERCLKDYKELLRMIGDNKAISQRIDSILEIIKKADGKNYEKTKTATKEEYINKITGEKSTEG
jgi:prefoldin subunit 5|tara:strand:+ start:86 stop:325 length:240 start_codon:yes stop_codon:yes gene_type:complete